MYFRSIFGRQRRIIMTKATQEAINVVNDIMQSETEVVLKTVMNILKVKTETEEAINSVLNILKGENHV